MLQFLLRSKNPGHSPPSAAEAQDVYGRLRIPPLQMSCSCRDGADVSPDGLRDPGVNRGFFLLPTGSGENAVFMQIKKNFLENYSEGNKKPPAPGGAEGWKFKIRKRISVSSHRSDR